MYIGFVLFVNGFIDLRYLGFPTFNIEIINSLGWHQTQSPYRYRNGL